jgi:hypothetical protein
MAVRDIVLYLENEAALRKKSRPVGRVTRRVKRLVRDLKDMLKPIDDSNNVMLVLGSINPSSVKHWTRAPVE